MAGFYREYMVRLTLFICLLTFDLCHSTPPTDVYRGLFNLREYLDEQVESFRADVHHSFQRQHQRIRRSASTDLTGELESQPPLLADNVTIIEHFFVGLQAYVIVGRKQAQDGSYQSSAKIHRFDGSTYPITGDFPTYGVSDIDTFPIGGHIYIAVANQLRDPGTYDGISNIYRFDTATEGVVSVQKIFTRGSADFQFFNFEGDTYLVLANFRGDAYAKYQAKLQLYVFSGAHFDLITSVWTYGATAIAFMEMEWEPYIVVAQYVDNDGKFDIGSVVYKFDTDKLVKVQTLATSAPKDIEAFLMNGNHYLAVANYQQVRADGVIDTKTDSVIYWWTGLQFIEYQRIPTQRATQWEQVELPNGEILLILSSGQNVTIYEFNMEAEWVTAEAQYTKDPSIEGDAVVEGIEAADGLFLVIGHSQAESSDYSNGTTNVFKIIASLQPQYIAPVDATTRCLRSLETRIDSLSSAIDDLDDKLNNTLKLTGNQEVFSKLDFKGNISTERTLNITNLTVVEEYSFNLERAIIDDGVSIENKLQTLRPQKDDVVTIGGEEDISSLLLFTQTVLSDNTTVVSTTTTANRINGIDIPNLNNTVVKLTEDQTIVGNVTFSKNVSLLNSHLHVEGDINGINIPDDVMTIGGTETARGYLIFTNATMFTNNVIVDGKVNGLNLSTDVVTTHQNHEISGTKTVAYNLDLVQNAIVASGMTVDSVDLSSFRSGAVSLTNGGTVSGVVTFQGQVKIDGQLRTDLVDGVNVTELDSSAVLKHTRQTIYGNKSFDGDFTASSHVNAYGEINGVPPSEFVLLRTPGQTINTPVRFAKNVSVIGSITANGFVNSLKIPDDIVTIAGPQNITGSVSFNEDISVIGDIEIKETVKLAGVDVSELPLQTVNISSSSLQTILGVKNFTEHVDVLGNITVDQFINGVNLTKLQQQILSLTKPQIVDLPLVVKGQLVIRGDLQLVNDTIDGYQLSQDLVRLNDVSNIEGYKIFKDVANISGDLLLGPGINISGVDLPDLNKTVIKLVATQTIGGDVLIKDDVAMKGDLNIDGLVNGLDISEDVVTLSGNQNITGDIKFEKVVGSVDVTTSSLNVSGEVNYISLDDLYLGAVMTTGQRVSITSFVTFDQLQVNNQLHVAGTVDGVDVRYFAGNVVTLSGSQTINGTWEFTSSVDFSQNLTVENVSGIHFNPFIQSVILKDTSGPITGPKIFSRNVSITGDITVADLINGINLEAVNQTYLSRTIPQSLSGLKTFTTSISVDNLHLSSDVFVEGIRPSTDLVLINIGGDSIQGTLWFSTFLEIDGNMDIGKTLNEIDLIEFNNSVVWLHGPGQTITGLWTLEGGMHVIGDIAMLEDMEVNGVDISDLSDILVSSDQNETIDLPTVFKAPVTIDGNIDGLGLINGVNMTFIYTDAVLSGPNQTILGAKDFINNLTAQHLVVETNMVSEVKAGMTNLTYLLNYTVLMSTDQEVAGTVAFTEDVVFQDHLIVDALVDGIDLSVQAVLNHTDQQLTGDNTFTNGFLVHGNITTTDVIDTVDVAQLANVVFLLDTYQIVQGKWHFYNNLTVYGNISVAGTVNGIDVDSELVTTSGNHVVTGSKTFDNDVVVRGSLLVGLVNGVNLTEFEKEIVHLVGEFNITGNKVFASEVILTNASVLGLVDRIDVGQLYSHHQNIAGLLYWQIAQLNYTLRSMCAPIASLQTAVKAQAVKLSHWEEEYQLNNSLATHRYDSVHIEGVLLIAFAESSEADIDACIGTTLYLCADDKMECYEFYDEPLSAASSVELFAYEEDVFIVLTLSRQSAACTSIAGTNDQVQILKMSNTTYEEYLPAQHGVDTAMFVIGNSVFLAVANQYDPDTGDKNVPSTIFEYDPTSDNFTYLQDIATTGSTAVTHLKHNGNNWLGITCGPGTTYSLIMLWNDTTHQFVLEASILTYEASDVLGLIVKDVPLMLFSNEKETIRQGTVDLNQPISVYEYSIQLGWTLKQDIDAVGVIQMDAFIIDKIYYLAAVSSVGSIDIYKWSGASEFEFYKALPINGVVFVHPFVQWGDLHMAVARPAYHAVIAQESSAFLRAIIRGKSESTVLEVNEGH
ncbi:uncharacterized protein LOC110980838 isoform X2 [Acanthaster planci]|uniref:Uncharacterized protein LOC110980838 isoform X2 n=1 Tax=Acanthaster planci TaxID=133434 RepID=A0A8B7YM67_ACAPL|nr:uncharacterized protein LOC110980838 isoform X2 [Acanthaster planci]